MTKKTLAINMTKAFHQDLDMSSKEQKILMKIVSQASFKPIKCIWRSQYWGTGRIGAVHYQGTYNDKPAVLKIQGIKPEISEIFMIGEFEKQNRSKFIRPTRIYHSIPWKSKNKFEAIIMEYAAGPKVLESKKIQSKKNIKKFLSFYTEYRTNCIPQNPWLTKPPPIDWNKAVKMLIKTSDKAYPNHPFRQGSDKKLAKQASQLLSQVYKKVPIEFMHGHFSVEDLIKQESEIILFSNLFWKWKYPFYDAVFGYHWFMYTLANVAKITRVQVGLQRKYWLDELYSLPNIKTNRTNRMFLKTALLERAVAGLIIDAFLIKPSLPVAKYLHDSTRKQVKILIEKLK